MLHTIFVDDGSTDDTVLTLHNTATAFPCTLLENNINRGPGYAFGSGFEHLHGIVRNDDWVITMEGDNTSRIDTIEHMLIRRKEGYDVVMASPYLYSGSLAGVSLLRTFLSHAGNALVKILLRIRGIMTFSCFLRLYKGSTIQKLQNVFGPRIIHHAGFECMVELLSKLILIQSRISEVEMTVDWGLRKGKSKMKIWKTIRGYLWLIFSMPECIYPLNRFGPDKQQ
jgi:dolichol-phosphate mannosyltransferase